MYGMGGAHWVGLIECEVKDKFEEMFPWVKFKPSSSLRNRKSGMA
jgi:hypothetical protein